MLKEGPCRPTLVKVLREKFAHCNLTYSIGGQISFDIFPQVETLGCIVQGKREQADDEG